MKTSLVNSKWVQGADRNLIRILLHGKQGEAEVMPGFGAEMDDAQIASLLTYIRRAWPPLFVKSVRRRPAARSHGRNRSY
jgi:mono/diheme cytochrome c family protein